MPGVHGGAAPALCHSAVPCATANPQKKSPARSGFGIAMAYLGWALAAGLAFAVYVQYNQRMAAENNMHIAENEMTRDAADSAQARASDGYPDQSRPPSASPS